MASDELDNLGDKVASQQGGTHSFLALRGLVSGLVRQLRGWPSKASI